MMQKFGILVIVAALGVVGAATGSSQQPDTVGQVLHAATQHLAREHQGVVKAEGHSPETEAALKRAEQAIEAAGLAQVAARGTTFSCERGKGPMGCSLRGADVLLAYREAKAVGNTATVVVEVRSRHTSWRQPIAWKLLEVALVKGDHGWTVSGERLLEIS